MYKLIALFITGIVASVLSLSWFNQEPPVQPSLGGFNDPFISYQLATSTLTNGYVLQTNGTDSFWVSTSSLGFTSGLSTTSPWNLNEVAIVAGSSTVRSLATSSLGLITTYVAEGTNLYYTVARFISELLNGHNAIFGNATTTNFVTTNSTSTNSFISSLVTTLANITNAIVTNLTAINATSTNQTITNLKLGTNTYTGEEIGRSLSTGIISGGEIGFVDTTHFSVSAGTGIIVDSYTDPTNPIVTKISWSASSSVLVADITADAYFVSIDSTGAIKQNQVLDFHEAGYLSSRIRLGGYATDGTQIIATANQSVPAANVGARLYEFLYLLGDFNSSGNVFFNANNNMTINKTAGVTFSAGSNYDVDKSNPNIVTSAAIATSTFERWYRDGAGSFVISTSTTINAANYDDGDGTLGNVQTNKWTTQLIYYRAENDSVAVVYGQSVQDSKNDALNDSIINPPVVSEDIARSFVLRSRLVVRGGATNLNNSSDAQFYEVESGLGSAGGTTGAVSSLQVSYENGSTIITDTTNGPVEIQGGTGSNASSSLDILNNAGSIVGSWFAHGGITTLGTSTFATTTTNGSARINNTLTVTGTSTLATTSISSLLIGSLTGFLKATAGAITTALINLASDVTGLLPVANGGTGTSTLTAGNFLVGNGTSAVLTTKVAPSGVVVGTTDTQTLTNKTLTSPILTMPATIGSSTQVGGTATSNYTPTVISGVDLGRDGGVSLQGGKALVYDRGSNTLFQGAPIAVGTGCSTSDSSGCELLLYSVNENTGALTYKTGADFKTASGADTVLVNGAVVLESGGEYLYVVTSNTAGTCDVTNFASSSNGCELRSFSWKNGVLTQIGGADLGSNGRDAVIKDGYLFVTDNSTIDVFDISNPYRLQLVDSIGSAITGVGLSIAGSCMYHTSTSNVSDVELFAYDITNPADAVVKTGVEYGGTVRGLYSDTNTLYVSEPNNLGIYNIGTDCALTKMSTTSLATAVQSMYVAGDYLYLTTSSGNEFQVWDVRNKSAPALIGGIDLGATAYSMVGLGGTRVVVAKDDSGVIAEDIIVIDVTGLNVQGIKAGMAHIGQVIINNTLDVGGRISSFMGQFGSGGLSSTGGIRVYSATSSKNVFTGGATLFGTTTPTTAQVFIQGANIASTSAALSTVNSIGSTLFHIQNGGNIGIGTVSPLYRLSVQMTTEGNTVQIKDSDGDCLLDPDSSSLVVTCSSDKKLKQNIHDTSLNSLDYLNKFRLREYTVKASGKTTLGVIAQELEVTNPELVSYGTRAIEKSVDRIEKQTQEDGTVSDVIVKDTVTEYVRDIKMVRLPSIWELVKAIQELFSWNISQDARLDALEQENEQLKIRLKSLEDALLVK